MLKMVLHGHRPILRCIPFVFLRTDPLILQRGEIKGFKLMRYEKKKMQNSLFLETMGFSYFFSSLLFHWIHHEETSCCLVVVFLNVIFQCCD